MNKPVAWISRLPEGDVYNCAWAEKQNDDDIPLYTQDQLEEARKLGMQQERALWNLAESTQEIMNPYKEITDTKIEPTVVSYTHPVKELTDEEIISTMVQFDVYSNDDQCLIDAGKAILRKAQEK